MFRVSILFLCSQLILGCSNFEASSNEDDTILLYLAHTRSAKNDSIVPTLYDLDVDNFDITMLGGDLATYSFEDGMEEHLDSIFNFKKPNVLWSVGNHDDATNEVYYKTTNKHKQHLYQFNDISVITLDSQDSLSSIIGTQKEFLFAALDTVSTQHIIILTHKLIFMDRHPVMDKDINKVCNGNKGDCYYCHNPNNFQEEIYPILERLQNKNIIWIGGDLGFKKTRYEYVDKAGITFLGNGMDYKRSHNEVILFRKTADTLTYSFVSIDSLNKYQATKKGLYQLLK